MMPMQHHRGTPIHGHCSSPSQVNVGANSLYIIKQSVVWEFGSYLDILYAVASQLTLSVGQQMHLYMLHSKEYTYKASPQNRVAL